jgi:hypothetical protein
LYDHTGCIMYGCGVFLALLCRLAGFRADIDRLLMIRRRFSKILLQSVFIICDSPCYLLKQETYWTVMWNGYLYLQSLPMGTCYNLPSCYLPKSKHSTKVPLSAKSTPWPSFPFQYTAITPRKCTIFPPQTPIHANPSPLFPTHLLLRRIR